MASVVTDTAANWAAKDAAAIGAVAITDDWLHESDTEFTKIWDGTSAYTALDYSWQPYILEQRAPMVHYRGAVSPDGESHASYWKGRTAAQMLTAGILAFDVLYEMDTGHWKVFDGFTAYDDIEYVTQTSSAVDYLLNIFGQVNIINMALGRLGQATITTIDENKPGAKLGRLYYRITFSEVMASYNWSSAVVRQQLTLVPDEVDGAANPDRNTFTGYELQYRVPTAPNPIRVIHLFTHKEGAYQRSDTEFKIEGNYLYTNIEDAGLVYIGDYSTQAGRLDPFVIELVVLRLAARMAFAITSSPQMTNQLMAEYREKMAEAQFADASRAREDTSRDMFPSPRSSWTEL